MYPEENITCLSNSFEDILKACLEVVDMFSPNDERTIAKIRVILLEYESNLLAKAGQEMIDRRETIMRSLESRDPGVAAELRDLFRS